MLGPSILSMFNQMMAKTECGFANSHGDRDTIFVIGDEGTVCAVYLHGNRLQPCVFSRATEP